MRSPLNSNLKTTSRAPWGKKLHLALRSRADFSRIIGAPFSNRDSVRSVRSQLVGDWGSKRNNRVVPEGRARTVGCGAKQFWYMRGLDGLLPRLIPASHSTTDGRPIPRHRPWYH